MADLEPIDFHVTLKKLLISQYQKPNFLSLINIIATIFSDIQDNNFLLVSKFWLADATGEQLDFLGKLWGEERLGETDVDYRSRIFTAIGRSSSGTIKEVQSFLVSAYGATYAKYSPEYPGKFRMNTDAFVSNAQMDEISPSGVTGFISGNILDAVGNNIVDANGNNIIHVSEKNRINIETIDYGLWNSISGEQITTVSYY